MFLDLSWKVFRTAKLVLGSFQMSGHLLDSVCVLHIYWNIVVFWVIFCIVFVLFPKQGLHCRGSGGVGVAPLAEVRIPARCGGAEYISVRGTW